MARVVPKKLFVRRRPCQFCLNKLIPGDYVDYKEQSLFYKLINMHGRILSSRITGTCARHQRAVALAVKRARYMAIIPYIGPLPKRVLPANAAKDGKPSTPNTFESKKETKVVAKTSEEVKTTKKTETTQKVVKEKKSKE
ncbi:30S ribosomal protein S18 [Metamycoplasma hyosynoviae]|nr:30S ribosomal protein S18 [Metamycoplasma hyosynoviae]MDC8911519.1 30S ribosomal protein S18 [Metamycoplasma hyosynoviae]